MTTSYGYDPAWRLSSLSHSLPGSASQAYTLAYNPADQIISNTSANSLYWWTGAVAATRGYTNNGLNQLATLTSSLNAGPFTLSYTDNNARSRGNLTSDGTNSYVYDETNHMISMSNGTTLAYDGLGRLYETVANQPTLTYDVFGQAYQTSQTAPTFFAYDDDKVIGEYDQNGNLQQRYIHGPGTDEPVVWYPVSTGNTPQWLLADHQGSIIAVTGSSGALLNGGQPNTYDEYGVPGGANYGRFQYTGQMWIPELGVYSYKARMYSPTLGRFFQTDPAGYKDDLDWYAYVGDDPIDHGDPTGEVGTCEADPTCKVVYDSGASQRTKGAGPTSAFVATGVAVVRGAATAGAEAGAATGATAAAGVAAVGCVLFCPSSTAKDDVPRRYLNHYTTAVGYEGISKSGFVAVSRDGHVYLTPDAYPSGQAAQSSLATQSTPIGYFRIPLENAAPAGTVRPVTPANGQPGGGTEVLVPRPVSISGATWVPIGQ